MPSERFTPITQLASVARSPTQRVARDAQREYTWADFSLGWRARLAQIATRPERRYLVATEDAFAFAVDWFALMVAGATAVVPPNRLDGTLAEAAQWCELSLGAQIPGRPCLPPPVLSSAAVPAPRFAEARVELHTSGSSGEPKRIVKTLAMLADEVAMLEGLWGERLGGALVLGTVPHHHIYGLLFRVMWPLAAGRPFFAKALPDPLDLQERMGEEAAVVLISTPAHLGHLPELFDLQAWRPKLVRVFSSGGPLPDASAEALRGGLGVAPTEVLGSTETGGIAWRVRTGETLDDAWTALPGVSLQIDAHSALAVTSPYAGVDRQQTGDSAVWLEDGRFRLTGRLDRVLKVAGKRLSLPEMEMRLMRHAAVAEAAVAALPERADRVGALVVPSAQGRALLATNGKRALVEMLRAGLEAYYDPVLLPRRWRVLEALPRDERGKLPAAAIARALRETDHDLAT